MTTEDLMKLLGDFPEINPSNYGDDDVNALNAWGIAAHTALEALGREVEQWKVDFNEVLIERDQARAQLAALQVDDELPEPAVGFDYDYYEGLIRYEAPVPRFCETSYYTADQLRQAKSKVRAKMVPLEKDAARLDWIQRNLFGHKWNGVVGSGCTTQWSIAPDYRHTTANIKTGDIEIDFRAAIDAAMGITGEPK